MGWFEISPSANVIETEAIAIAVLDSEPSAPPPASNPHYQRSSPQHHQSVDLPRHPAFLTECPHCHVKGSTTRTRTAPAFITWLACTGLVLLFWPLCWLPLVMDSMKKTEHYCQNCQMMVGEVPPMQDCCVHHRSG